MGEKPVFCPHLVIAAAYYATPFLFVGIRGWGPRASPSDRPMYLNRAPWRGSLACAGAAGRAGGEPV
eukprot:5806001-Pyramimonas_sp.AAC.1